MPEGRLLRDIDSIIDFEGVLALSKDHYSPVGRLSISQQLIRIWIGTVFNLQ